MAKGTNSGSGAGGVGRGWEDGRAAYACADGVEARIPDRGPGEEDQVRPGRAEGAARACPASRNAIVYRPGRGDTGSLRLFVAGTELDRGVSAVVRVAARTKTMTFPGTTREARNSAFSGVYEELRALRSVVLNEGLEALGGCSDGDSDPRYGVFTDTQLRQVALPATLRQLGDRVFSHCRRLCRVVLRGQAPGADGEAVLPAALEKVGSYMFYKCPLIRAVWVESSSVADCLRRDDSCDSVAVLPGRQTVLGDAPLWELRGQKRVVVPEGAQRIGTEWFKNSEVESVEIPASVAEIGDQAFYGCEGLRKVTFAQDSRLKRLGAESFCGSGIEDITIPRSVSEIRPHAFGDCRGLRAVAFEEGSGLETLQTEVFADCCSLAEVVLPDSLGDIGRAAFRGCRSLESVLLPDGLERLGPECFSGSGLMEVVLPSTVREVGARAFADCWQLRAVELNEGLETLGRKEAPGAVEGQVFAGSAIASVKVPSTLKRLEADTFRHCYRLRSVEIPRGVERIGERCFRDRRIEELVLPATLQEIGRDAFANCKALRVVWVEEGCGVDVAAFVDSGVEVCRR